MGGATTALEREFPAGTVLFREGDPGSRMFVIRTGRVKIYREVGKGELVLAFLGPGDFLGEMALLEGLPRSASAQVVETSSLVEVDAAAFEEMIRRNIEIAVRIMRKLASRVRDLDGRLENFVVESGQARALEVLRWLLPQGIMDDHWIRVKDITQHLDFAAQAGIPRNKAQDVVDSLTRAGCMRVDGDDILIAEKAVLDNYESYLTLKRDYSDTQLGEDDDHHPRRAMRRLLGALRLDEDQIESRQQNLMSKYERYMELKKRFGGIDP